MVSKYLEVLTCVKGYTDDGFLARNSWMTWLSTHLGPPPKMSWGDGRRQADVGDTEDQRGTGTGGKQS